MMRKIWILIVGVSLLVIGLTACFNATNNPDSTNENANEQNQNSDELVEQTPDELNENNNGDEVEENDKVGDSNEPKESLENMVNIHEDNSITALVNKHNSLSERYVPEDLVTVRVPTVLENPEVKQLRKVAAHALQKMFNKAKEADIYLHARSGYRSYDTQVQLFNNYVAQHGQEAANRYSARPGQSEHQTGLVMDVTSESVNFQLTNEFGETKEGKWLSEHAHEFGFIIRYPKDMEHITGYIYEPWHIRYLGLEVAMEVYESGLTYEEFLVREGVIHEVNAEANDS